jgi:hypothetical protein
LNFRLSCKQGGGRAHADSAHVKTLDVDAVIDRKVKAVQTKDFIYVHSISSAEKKV